MTCAVKTASQASPPGFLYQSDEIKLPDRRQHLFTGMWPHFLSKNTARDNKRQAPSE